MNKASNPTQASGWSVQWFQGELCQMETAMKVMDHLDMLKRNADTAKVIQGTEDGHPVVYILTRWG